MNPRPPCRADLEIGAPIWIRDRLDALSYVISVHQRFNSWRLSPLSNRSAVVPWIQKITPFEQGIHAGTSW
jgi:hypothetical protein